MREVPEVLVLRVVCLAAYLERDVVLFGVFYLLLTGFDVPDTPGSDYLHIGCESFYRKLETHLVVALACAAVADGVRALGFGYFNESLRD